MGFFGSSNDEDATEQQFAAEIGAVAAEQKRAEQLRDEQAFRDAWIRMEPWAYRSGRG